MLGCHVVVTGVAGAGKTTLATALAENLGVVLLSKDRLKESMYRAAPVDGTAGSLRLSSAAMQILYDTAADTSAGTVLDANWQPNLDAPLLAQLPLPLVQVFCDLPPPVAQRRLLVRVESGERHPVHRDAMDADVLKALVREAASPGGPLAIPGPVLRVDTSGAIDLTAVVSEARALAHRATTVPSAEATNVPAESFSVRPGGWNNTEQVDAYLARVGRLPRVAGEELLVDLLPARPERVLDLGCGDGRLAAMVLQARPAVQSVVALDISAPMLERARRRFTGDRRVEVVDRDLNAPLDDLGSFDVVVSGCAIHHLDHHRKRSLFQEIACQLRPSGLFANLDVVQSATSELHSSFLAAVGRDSDDPEDQLAAVEPQLAWMRDAGLRHVDCLWRWRGLALLVGQPSPTS